MNEHPDSIFKAAAQAAGAGHRQKEAFALMQYESDDRTVRRWIWNSRDAVTPFCVTIEGVECRHVRWGEDVYAPDHQPPDDGLVFVTWHPSLDECRAMMRSRVESMPEYAPPAGPERDAFVDELARGVMTSIGEVGTPQMVTGAQWRQASR